MPLSTSNSEERASSSGRTGNRITIVQVYQLLAVIALTCATIEVVMWWYTHEVSRYVRHFEVEYKQAVGVRHGSATKSVLIVGNSTLIYGVNVDALKKQLGPSYECHVLGIESTTFLDWYFALKELFRRGARPDYVVLILPANNVLESFPVPDFSAYYLIGGRDILALAWAESLKATAASELAVEHFSAFYTSRGALRATVKKHLFPGFENVATKYMKRGGSKRPPALVTNRLRDLKAVCDKNEATIVFVIPPTNQPDATGASRVLALAREAQVAAAMPLPDSALTPSYYSDGFHLNEAGRDLFTTNLIVYLRGLLISQAERAAIAQTAKN
jgi:hypothetical protein